MVKNSNFFIKINFIKSWSVAEPYFYMGNINFQLGKYTQAIETLEIPVKILSNLQSFEN